MDEPLAALNCLHESSFDVVIDTVGGRRRTSFFHLLLFEIVLMVVGSSLRRSEESPALRRSIHHYRRGRSQSHDSFDTMEDGDPIPSSFVLQEGQEADLLLGRAPRRAGEHKGGVGEVERSGRGRWSQTGR